jgi:dephospho-CoA kinase
MTGGSIIGLTGNSGAGKGEAALFMKRHGAYVIDADVLAHESMKRGEPAYGSIARLFGESVLGPDGEINRKLLGTIVYHDAKKKGLLESIIHVEVKRKTDQITNDALSNAAPFVVWDAPLLIEAGMHKMCDAVILLTAPFEVKLSRIVTRDNISGNQAALRLHNQRDEAKLLDILKRDIAPQRIFIIDNDAGLGKLHEGISRVLRSLDLP